MTYTSGLRNSPKNCLHKGAFKLKRSSVVIPSIMIVILMIFLKGAQDQLPECDEHSVQSHNKVRPRCFNIFTQQPIQKPSMQNNRCAITRMFTEQRNHQSAWSWQLLRNVCQPSSRRECTMVPMKTCSKEPKKQVMKMTMMRSKMMIL